jgi:hypothetical protein
MINRQKAKAALFKFIEIDKNGRWICTATLNKENGYPYFSYDGRKVSAHRFCYEIYNGKIPKDYEVDHINADKLDVTPSNLEGVTRKVNAERASLRGAYRGRSSFLTANEVLNMKILAEVGIKRKIIAELFEVPISTLKSILSGKRWGWVKVK